jgi:hypothetical protein
MFHNTGKGEGRRELKYFSKHNGGAGGPGGPGSSDRSILLGKIGRGYTIFFTFLSISCS